MFKNIYMLIVVMKYIFAKHLGLTRLRSTTPNIECSVFYALLV